MRAPGHAPKCPHGFAIDPDSIDAECHECMMTAINALARCAGIGHKPGMVIVKVADSTVHRMVEILRCERCGQLCTR